MPKIFTILLFLVVCTSLVAQNDIAIKFNALTSDFFVDENESDCQVSTCKVYISQLQFLKGDKVILSEKHSFHLLDFRDEKSLELTIPSKRKRSFDAIVFVLGIDSATNHLGVQGGDLDPMMGMYWAWQSGYINFKIEGTSNLCPTDMHKFTLHIGGFLNGTSCDEKVHLPIENMAELNIDLDLNSFFQAINLEKVNHIMSPGEEAMKVSRELAKCFKVGRNEN